MNAETMIKEYWNYKKQAELLKNQLADFKGVSETEIIEAMNFSRPQEERVQTSNISDKTPKIALKYNGIASRANNDLYVFIFKKYRYCIKEISFFETSVNLLPQNLSSFISDMVFDKLSWSKLSQKHNISRRTVARYRKRAVNELNKLYAYRGSLEKEFIMN